MYIFGALLIGEVFGRFMVVFFDYTQKLLEWLTFPNERWAQLEKLGLEINFLHNLMLVWQGLKP